MQMRCQVEPVNAAEIGALVSGALAALPEWRRKKALAYRLIRDQYTCARAFLLLEELLRREFGLREVPEFSYGEYGKPYFREYPRIHFSISHSPLAIACAVAEVPVGVDVEGYTFDPQLAEAALSPKELSEVKKSAWPEREFAHFWTKKEALLKLRGSGIDGDMRALLEREGGKVNFQVGDCQKGGYITTAAVWK